MIWGNFISCAPISLIFQSPLYPPAKGIKSNHSKLNHFAPPLSHLSATQPFLGRCWELPCITQYILLSTALYPPSLCHISAHHGGVHLPGLRGAGGPVSGFLHVVFLSKINKIINSSSHPPAAGASHFLFGSTWCKS